MKLSSIRALALSLALGCSFTAVSAQAADLVKFGQLRVPTPVFVGIEKGYFEEQGIEVELVFLRSGAEVASSLAAGHIDIGASTAGAALFNAMARDVGSKIVAEYIAFTGKPSANGIVVRRDLAESGEITGAADLAGANVAITAQGQLLHMLLDVYLKLSDVDPAAVNLVTMPFPDMQAAFEGKAIDAAVVAEPYVTIGNERELTSLLVDAYDIIPGMSFGVVMYGERLLDTDRDLGQRFMNALVAANGEMRAMLDDPSRRAELAEILHAYVPLQSQDLYEKAGLSTGREGMGIEINQPGGLADQLQWSIEQGLIPVVPDLPDFVDTGFTDAIKSGEQ